MVDVMANLENPTLRRAMSNVATWVERLEDPAWLVATFVDNGIIDLVNNNNNQIIHGRRGTGKIRLFRVLETKMADNPSSIVCYLDARTLGSNLLFTDVDRPIHMRCSGLFKDHRTIPLKSQKLSPQLALARAICSPELVDLRETEQSQNQVLPVPLNFTPSVATRDRTPFVERRLTNHVLRRHDGFPGGQAISFDLTFSHVGYLVLSCISQRNYV